MRTDCFLYITSHKWNSCLSIIDHARLFMHEFLTLTLPLLHMLLVRKYTADYACFNRGDRKWSEI
jgi:hypothetical protein